MSFNDKRVWFITGTSSGLGKALLEAVLEAGERAVATARKTESLNYIKDKYPAEQLLIQQLDVTQKYQILKVFEEIKSHFGRLDIVVNNAGYAVFGEMEAISDQDARNQFEVQFWGPVNITREAIKFFREVNPKGHGGRILNISTIGGYDGRQGLSFYSSSKFALEGFTESVLKEMVPEWNITGCIIEPGGFETEWRGGSMVTYPPHPAYVDPSTPTSRYRNTLRQSKFIGVPERFAQAMLKIADLPELPKRIPLGSGALAIMRAKAAATIKDSERFADISHSTDKDGIDVEDYMRKVILA
ncbi:NAD(P)-binding protein [Crucibulum laeve]|uniref:NAD(P)-binding protein n=1 Tax=Crucibulum laeve TaxID=68775 RepID=A0A5C3LYP5_9AGAR|nr:NAD(P)-binding protein [Crucibulum laeve]